MRALRVAAVLLLLGVAAAAAGYYLLNTPYAGFREQVFVDIPRGTSTRGIAVMLSEAGIVRTEWEFVAARAFRPRARLQAGEYLFKQPASVLHIYDRLARGDIFYYEVPVPEGSNMFDIAASLDAIGVIPGADFLRVARDPSLIKALAPKAPSLEGYLFPDTYRITRHTTAQQFSRQMVDRFRKVWQGLNAAEADVHDTVTLASLVEKEAKVPEERTLIASVFSNRLQAAIPLQCDPTTIYAALLENRYRGTIYRSDLASTNPYNTYQHAGLPPGPIANSGVESLKAALHPAETEYIYFVAVPDGSGKHYFSKDLSEHARAVQKYRRAAATAQAQTIRGIPEPKAAAPGHRPGVARTPGSAETHF